QVMRRGQRFLCRSVLGIRRHVVGEDIAGYGGDDLVRRHRAETPYRMAAHRKAARWPQVRVLGAPQCKRMIDAHAEEIGPVLLHVVNGRIDIAWTHVATAKAGRSAVHPRNAVDSLLAVLSIDRIAEGS